MIMLDPHRISAAGTHARASRDEPHAKPDAEPRAEPRLAPFDAAAIEARMLRALRTRVRRIEIDRAPDSLRERVRTMLDLRA